MTTIISIGNGGCNVADSVRKNAMGLGDARFIYCDTNAEDLAKHGKSKDARLLLSSDMAEFPDIFPKGCETLVVIATLGGKTGNHIAPLATKKAKEIGIKSIIGAVTLPFGFEGEQHGTHAREAAKQMAENCHEMVVRKNEDLAKTYPELNFVTAFDYADIDMAKTLEDIIP